MGNPLYRSPLYNEDGHINIQNNRFKAFHLGVSGEPWNGVSYRLLTTWQEGLGTYKMPFAAKQNNVSVMLEVGCQLKHGWDIRGCYGGDFGRILGNNQGVQLTIGKHGVFNL